MMMYDLTFFNSLPSANIMAENEKIYPVVHVPRNAIGALRILPAERQSHRCSKGAEAIHCVLLEFRCPIPRELTIPRELKVPLNFWYSTDCRTKQEIYSTDLLTACCRGDDRAVAAVLRKRGRLWWTIDDIDTAAAGICQYALTSTIPEGLYPPRVLRAGAHKILRRLSKMAGAPTNSLLKAAAAWGLVRMYCRLVTRLNYNPPPPLFAYSASDALYAFLRGVPLDAETNRIAEACLVDMLSACPQLPMQVQGLLPLTRVITDRALPSMDPLQIAFARSVIGQGVAIYW